MANQIHLSVEQAVALLDGDEIHTFLDTSFMAGADVRREALEKDIIRAGGASLVVGAHRMASMGHNLYVKCENGPMYVEVPPERMARHLC